MKKNYGLFLGCLSLIFALTACSSGEAEPPATTEEGNTAQALDLVDSVPQDFEVKENGEEVELVSYSGTGTHAIIPEGVTYIRPHAFSNNPDLVAVTFPDSVTTIGGSAFALCTGITSLTFGTNVDMIDEYAFQGCSSLTKIDFANVTNIKERAFFDCDALTELTLGLSVSLVWYEAFADCAQLAQVTIPNNVEFIDERAFDVENNITYLATADSYGHTWADENGFNITIS